MHSAPSGFERTSLCPCLPCFSDELQSPMRKSSPSLEIQQHPHFLRTSFPGVDMLILHSERWINLENCLQPALQMLVIPAPALCAIPADKGGFRDILLSTHKASLGLPLLSPNRIKTHPAHQFGLCLWAWVGPISGREKTLPRPGLS